MCGDLDEEDQFEGDLYQRFLVHSQAMLAKAPAGGDELNRYLDSLFNDLLARCVRDDEQVASPNAYPWLKVPRAQARRHVIRYGHA